MLWTLSSLTFDPSGFIQIPVNDDNTIGATARRVNRVATLDGGAAVNDFGFSEADRTIELRWPAGDRAIEDPVRRMVQTYATLHIATRSGVFLAAPETYQPGADESLLRLLVLSRASI